MNAAFLTGPPWDSNDIDQIPPQYTIVAELPSVTWGWEGDLHYWILRDSQCKHVIGTTAHGSFCIAPTSALEDQIRDLTDFIEATKKGLEMLSDVPTTPNANPTPENG